METEKGFFLGGGNQLDVVFLLCIYEVNNIITTLGFIVSTKKANLLILTLVDTLNRIMQTIKL